MKRFFLIGAAAVAALPVFFAAAAIPETKAVNAGAAFLLTVQDAQGGYGASSAGQAFDSVYAVRAAGFDPAKDVIAGGKSPVDYLKANAAAQTKPASAAKAALAAKALGVDPKAVNGTDLIKVISGGQDAATGKYAGDDFSQSIAMLGLACTGNAVPANAVTALKATQGSDGGWGFGGFSDADTTAIAVQALLATGLTKSDAAVAKGVTYLKTSEAADGGWGYDPTASNASSTAFAIQALIAAGEDVNKAQNATAKASPVAFLLSQQNADGSFIGFDAVYSTNQAVPALAGRTFCNAPATTVTQTRPVAAPATPTVGPAVTAPKPPATGNSAGTGSDWSPVLVALAGFAAAAGAVSVARRRS